MFLLAITTNYVNQQNRSLEDKNILKCKHRNPSLQILSRFASHPYISNQRI